MNFVFGHLFWLDFVFLECEGEVEGGLPLLGVQGWVDPGPLSWKKSRERYPGLLTVQTLLPSTPHTSGWSPTPFPFALPTHSKCRPIGERSFLVQSFSHLFPIPPLSPTPDENNTTLWSQSDMSLRRVCRDQRERVNTRLFSRVSFTMDLLHPMKLSSGSGR